MGLSTDPAIGASHSPSGRSATGSPVATTVWALMTKLAVAVRGYEYGEAARKRRRIPGVTDATQLNRSDRDAPRKCVYCEPRCGRRARMTDPEIARRPSGSVLTLTVNCPPQWPISWNSCPYFSAESATRFPCIRNLCSNFILYSLTSTAYY